MRAKIGLMRKDSKLTDRTSKLSLARGLLTVTGVLECLEEEYGPK